MYNATAAVMGRSGRPRTRQAGGRRRWSVTGMAGTGLALLTLSGCAAGQDAETTHEVPDVAGVHGSVGNMVLDDVFIDSGGTAEAGTSVPLRGAFANNAETPDQLVRVSTPAARSVQLLGTGSAPSALGVGIPADDQVDAVNGAVRLRLFDVTSPIATTQLVPVTFMFSGVGQVRLGVPVTTPGSP
jgi:copper(I)-binding protein